MPLDDAELKAILTAGGDRVAAILKRRASDLIDESKVSADFLEDRAKRLFELGVQLAQAQSPDERGRLVASIETVKDAITSELWAVAVDTSAETRSALREIVGTVKDFAVEVLPVAAKILIAAL